MLRGESYVEKSEGQRNVDEYDALRLDSCTSSVIEIAVVENVGQGMFYLCSLPFIVPKI